MSHNFNLIRRTIFYKISIFYSKYGNGLTDPPIGIGPQEELLLI